MYFYCVLVAALLGTASALYGPKSDVVQVGADKFKEEVLKHKGIVVVEFFAPWCGHCKSLVPEYEKAASVLNGVVKVVAVDATENESLASRYQIQGFPTIKIFGADKRQPADYQGQRTADAIVTEAMKATSSLVRDRKTGKKGGSGSNGSKKSNGGSKSGGSKSDVVELTDLNFNALVMESNDLWLVEFFAPWCGHCKKLEPEWARAATMLKSDGIKLGAVDATVHTQLAQKYGVKGYPTIKVFGAGPKGKAKDYTGPRESDGIVDFARSTLEASGVPVVLHELTDNSVFNEACGGVAAKLCAVLFVPHILDTGAAGRAGYLELFQEVAQDFRKMPFAFAWTEGGAHPELEQTVSVNGNYPTVAVLSMEKKVAATMRVSWSKKNVKDFMQGVLSGSERTAAFASTPSVQTVSKWDGKDGKLEVDEIPLDELFGDD